MATATAAGCAGAIEETSAPAQLAGSAIFSAPKRTCSAADVMFAEELKRRSQLGAALMREAAAAEYEADKKAAEIQRPRQAYTKYEAVNKTEIAAHFLENGWRSTYSLFSPEFPELAKSTVRTWASKLKRQREQTATAAPLLGVKDAPLSDARE